MKKYRDLINRPHPACKIVSVSIPAIRLDKKMQTPSQKDMLVSSKKMKKNPFF